MGDWFIDCVDTSDGERGRAVIRRASDRKVAAIIYDDTPEAAEAAAEGIVRRRELLRRAAAMIVTYGEQGTALLLDDIASALGAREWEFGEPTEKVGK